MRLRADNPWKDVCQERLDLLFRALWPRAFAGLDWGRDHEGLDTELRKLTADVVTGQRIADRLVKAFDATTGDARYFHLEVQGKQERGFRRRVHVCNARCEERFGCHVTSLVVLTDTNPRWRPSRYVAGCYPVSSEERAGGRMRRYHDERTLRFLTVKLIDFEGQEERLEADDNPVGLFLVAHLTALRTRRQPERRAEVKLRLLLNLRQRKMTPGDVQFWERCFDWLLDLPEPLNRSIWEHLQRLDAGEQMAFISYAEQRGLEKGIEKGIERGIEQGIEKGIEQGIEKGIEKGIEQGIERGVSKGLRQSLASFLKLRHRDHAAELLALLDAVADESRLPPLCEAVFAAENPDGVRAALVAAAAP